ncbi:MAG TPA: acylneuraminate cytidylyltransferase [Sandaracinaceae bacterium LLY-WYZ-13_1]|nr:acylneuraminate cytidylyltransferase [Sandaracinaceae bacterium LLY-WYZ-13_1]
MSCVAVIPARGGSKGVPRKNVADLAGLPLVAHTIRCARGAMSVDRVLVSTDDAEIAAVARAHGAEVVRRPAPLASDTASSESALRHALEALDETPDLVIMLQCTSPLTRPSDLDGAVATLRAEAADSCFTAVPFTHFLWERTDHGAVGINHDGGPRVRRQDLAPQYLENGAVYVMRTARFLAEGTRFCGRTALHPVDPARAIEIDEPLDFVKAEALARALEDRERLARIPGSLDTLVLDFDGVLTDDAVTVREDGTEEVRCHRGDGMGLSMLRAAGVEVLILSKERNPVVSARARKLGVECLQGIDDKLPALRAWLEARGRRLSRAAFVGNDVNDLACMRAAGFSACPSDAHPRAKAAARLVLTRRGGHGAVRELCDRWLERIERTERRPTVPILRAV